MKIIIIYSIDQQNRISRIKKLVCIVLISMIAFCASVSIASAESVSSEWGAMATEAGSIIQTLALAGGAVGLAWCEIEYAYGSEDTSRRAKAKAIAIVAAVAGVFLLPFFIRLGKSIGSQFKWSPRSLG